MEFDLWCGSCCARRLRFCQWLAAIPWSAFLVLLRGCRHGRANVEFIFQLTFVHFPLKHCRLAYDFSHHSVLGRHGVEFQMVWVPHTGEANKEDTGVHLIVTSIENHLRQREPLCLVDSDCPTQHDGKLCP